MKQGIVKANLSEIPSDLQQMMEDIDSDGSGVIDYTEFLAATLDKRVYIKEDVCWNAFRNFDRNGDGKISPDELKLVLGDTEVQSKSDKDVSQVLKAIMAGVDNNGDGLIDFEEFMAMMKAQET